MATKKNAAPVEENTAENIVPAAPVEENTAENIVPAAPVEVTGPKMVKVRIPRTKKDEEDVFVSVNLNTYIIKRGVEVEVPDFVAEVLRHQEEMLEEIMLFEQAVSK